MPVQLALIQDETIKKSIITVPIDQLTLSRFNPRTTRPDEDVDKLANRIARNGFEITRALWAYQNGSGYEVFAGGTRLEAAKRAGLNEVPVVLHEGLTEEDIVRLAEEDNENDEYHTKVSDVEKWAHCAYLKDAEGWSVEQIAEAKRKEKSQIYNFLNLHKLPQNIKNYSNQGMLSEAHLIQIISIPIDWNFSSWLTVDQIQLEIVQEAISRKLTTRKTKDLVDKWQSMIQAAQDAYLKLKERQESYEAKNNIEWKVRWCDRFVLRLADTKARTKAAINEAYSDELFNYQQAVSDHEIELAKQRDEAEAERLRLEQETEKNKQIQAILDQIILGDFANIAPKLEDESIDAIITDPPYKEKYLPLYGLLAKEAARLLKPGKSLLVMCGQYHLPKILELMTPYLDYYWTFSYQTPGGQSPQIFPRKVNTFWKPVLWFVKGEYEGEWHGDVIKSDVNDNDKRFHKWGQSESGTVQLVERFTDSGDTVLDPFIGGGTTGVVSIGLGRKFIGVDLDPESIQISRDRIFTLLQGGTTDE